MSETTETNPQNAAETATASETATAPETATVPGTERTRTALNRVTNLSIFFVGVGVYAATGLGLREAALFESLQVTYFAVGSAVGAVGLLLWLVAR